VKYGRTAGRLALLAAIGAGALSASTGSALADSQCSYDASFHRVNVYDGSGSADLRIARSGQYIVVQDGANGPTSYCSSATGIATVTNTDKVIVDGTAGGYVIDESGGELGPGWTQESDGKSEIEVTVRAPYDPYLQLTVVGSPGADTIKFAGGSQVKLGNDNDVDAQIIDRTSAAQLSARFKVANGLGGDDMLSAAENASTFGSSTSLNGGENSDTLIGGPGLDYMYGEAGDDDLRAFGGGTDYLGGGSGSDSATADATDNLSADIEWKVLG
jgi:hypothetical protein